MAGKVKRKRSAPKAAPKVKSVETYVDATVTLQEKTQPQYSRKPGESYAARLFQWVYICASKNAEMCASTPIRLYRNAKGGRVSKIRAKTLRRIKAEYGTGEDVVEVDRSIGLDMLARPNQFEDGFSFCYRRFMAKESMGNIRGNLAARGLTDSTIGDAFQARNDRDLALTQQDLSERKSARRLGYDIDLTNNANAFIERRTDRGPDNTALLALSAKLGEAEAYRKGKMEAAAAAQRRGTRSRGRSNQPPYLGPQGIHPALAAMLATGMQQNFLGGLGGAMGMMGRGGGGPAYISNRYPTKRSGQLDITVADKICRKLGFKIQAGLEGTGKEAPRRRPTRMLAASRL